MLWIDILLKCANMNINLQRGLMYTYLLKNKQGNFETTTMRFATRKQATREAKTYASCWINLTGDYIVLQLSNFKKV